MKQWSFFTSNELRPADWLRRQLEIQAAGLSGNLDKVWPDVRDSAWVGGSREGWERVPYWLDGFIPLAYLLDDEDMKQRVERYMNAILDQQQEDGWICPCTVEERTTYDIWSWFLIAKVLALYCEFTDSEKAETALYRTMKLLYEMMKKEEVTLFDWGKFRWYECFIPLHYLYEKSDISLISRYSIYGFSSFSVSGFSIPTFHFSPSRRLPTALTFPPTLSKYPSIPFCFI